MNDKINLRQLSEEVAQATNQPCDTVQQHIKQFFNTVEAELGRGQSVVVPGLGEFSRSTDTSEPVKLTVNAELQATLNAPFAILPSVELAPGFDTNRIISAEQIPHSKSQTTPIQPNPTTTDTDLETATASHPEEEPPTPPAEHMQQMHIAASDTTVATAIISQNVETDIKPLDQDPEEFVTIRSHSKWNTIGTLILGILIGLLLGILISVIYISATLDIESIKI